MDNNKEYPRFPLFISLAGKKVVVVGGGRVAERRIGALLRFGAEILVISPEITPKISRYVGDGSILYKNREYQQGDISAATLVVAATNSRTVNRGIGKEAESLGVYVSVADKKEESSFYFPGLVQERNLVAGVVSTNGDHTGVKRAVAQLQDFWKEEQR